VWWRKKEKKLGQKRERGSGRRKGFCFKEKGEGV
jgi:hypothetical protein